ncbi:hypothetical protein SPLC1_S310020 [Arthrospira platensis C1]|nr:hypothetical protein SPLC1_S310020 [Arthrospira platensis C1]
MTAINHGGPLAEDFDKNAIIFSRFESVRLFIDFSLID